MPILQITLQKHLDLIPVTHGRQTCFEKDDAVDACVGDEPLSFVGDKPCFNRFLEHVPKKLYPQTVTLQSIPPASAIGESHTLRHEPWLGHLNFPEGGTVTGIGSSP